MAGAESLALGLLLLAAGARAGAGQQVCSRCPGPAQNSSLVAGYCSSRQDAVLRGRCCLSRDSGQEAVVGLDLGNCSLQQIVPGFQEASTAVIIDLTGNPLQSLPDGAFRGFTHLQTLALPPSLDCPGGSAVWDSVSTVGGSRTCRGQRRPCNGTAQPAWLCPENALCAADGPGLPQCLCAAPYHGYKCLRQGVFPYLMFYGILGAVTASLAFLLWGTQRLKAKPS